MVPRYREDLAYGNVNRRVWMERWSCVSDPDSFVLVLVVVLPMAPLEPLRKCLFLVVLSTDIIHITIFNSPSGVRNQSGCSGSRSLCVLYSGSGSKTMKLTTF
jgi:hypothetical protein